MRPSSSILVIFTAISLAFGIPGIAAADSGAPASQQTAVRLDAPFPAIDFAPFYIAKSKGWLEENLKQVNATPVYVGALGEIALSIESLGANKLDMYLTSALPPIIGRASGIKEEIIWLSCILNSEFVVRKQFPATSFKDMAGLKVGTLAGADSHYWLLRRIGEEKLSPDFLHIVLFARPDDVVAALESGSIDAEALFPPFPERSLISGTARVVGDRTYPIEVVMVARSQFVHDHADVVEAVNAALDRGKQWLRSNRTEAQAIVAQQTGIPPNVVAAAWPKIDWNATFSPSTISDIQAKADFLFNQHKINSTVDVKSDLVSKLALPN